MIGHGHTDRALHSTSGRPALGPIGRQSAGDDSAEASRRLALVPRSDLALVSRPGGRDGRRAPLASALEARGRRQADGRPARAGCPVRRRGDREQGRHPDHADLARHGDVAGDGDGDGQAADQRLSHGRHLPRGADGEEGRPARPGGPAALRGDAGPISGPAREGSGAAGERAPRPRALPPADQAGFDVAADRRHRGHDGDRVRGHGTC